MYRYCSIICCKPVSNLLFTCTHVKIHVHVLCDTAADLGGSGEEVEVVEVQEYVGDPAYGTATTQLHKVDMRFISFLQHSLSIRKCVYSVDRF